MPAGTWGTNSKLYANGFDLTDFLRNIKLSAGISTANSEVMGDTAKKFVSLLREGSLVADGLFGGEEGEIDEVITAGLGASRVIVTVLINGGAVGSSARGFDASGTAYDINSPHDGLVSVSAALQSRTGIERCLVLHADSEETDPDDGPGQDNGASSLNGGVAFVQVLDFDGTDCTIKVQDSTDNNTFADLITFTTVTAAPFAERKEVAGTVDRYTRWSIDGTFNAITFLLCFGRKV